MDTSKRKSEIFENIYDKQLVLSCNKIGKSAGGCQICLKFQNTTKTNVVFLGFVPLICCILLHFIINASLILYFLSVLILFIILYSEFYKFKSEKVSLIPHIGLQYSVEYERGINKDTFIQWENLDSFIINEVIEKQRIIYIASVIKKNELNETSLVSLFQVTKPRLKCLEEIYNQLQNVLEKYSNQL